MVEHTPTPWKVEDNCLGVYPISAKQGPITVQAARAFGEDDAALIVEAVNSHDTLLRTLQHIAAMRTLPDDRANRITLVAAIEMARTTLSAVKAISNVVGGAPK